MSAFNTDEEREASPIGALYPYLQHRKPECTTSCVCGAREAIQAVERHIMSGEVAHREQAKSAAGWRQDAEAAAELAVLVEAARTALDGSHADFGRALFAMWAGLDEYQKARALAPGAEP